MRIKVYESFLKIMVSDDLLFLRTRNFWQPGLCERVSFCAGTARLWQLGVPSRLLPAL